MSDILEIKFRVALFGFKAVSDLRDTAIFNVVIKGSEFEESIRALEKSCEEDCKDKKVRKKFYPIIFSIKESSRAEKIEDLFNDQEFEQAVVALEEIYKSIYKATDEYDLEYQYFLREVKRIADSQPEERKSSSIGMWKKGLIGFAIATAGAAAYYYKKRKKESDKK